MLAEPLRRRVTADLRLLWPRLVERPLWRWWWGARLPDTAAVAAEVVELPSPLLPLGSYGGGARGDRVPAGADVRRAAEEVLQARFEVFGQVHDLGRPIDWHTDWTTGRGWPLDLAWTINYTNMGESSDVKVPWEVSRCHWMTWLGLAWRESGEARFRDGFVELAGEWLDANPVGRGIHWACQMEVAIRAVNWIAAYGLFAEAPGIPRGFWSRYVATLRWHARFIRGNLEVGRRSNNHYLADACGLFLTGLFFQGTWEGRRWAACGQRILEQQARWQVHPDGVHFEKSISYHRLVTEMLLVALACGDQAGRPFSRGYRERVRGMLRFMEAYSREDGTTPLFSDSDDGRLLRFTVAEAPTDHRGTLQVGSTVFADPSLRRGVECHPDVYWLLGCGGVNRWRQLGTDRPGIRSASFPRGGYHVLRTASAHFMMDAGPIGFDGGAGHGHNDTLSFELAAGQDTFIVDSGTYCYTSDPDTHRELARGRAHNTIEVDGQEMAVIVGLWRIASDGTRPRLVQIRLGGAEEQITAEHQGYRRLAGDIIHRRDVRFARAEHRWLVTDTVRGTGRHRLVWSLHLHPDVEIGARDPDRVVLEGSSGRLVVDLPGSFTETAGWYAPRYRFRRRAPVLEVVLEGVALPRRLDWQLQWYPNEGTPVTPMRVGAACRAIPDHR
ncbi:MAG: alginate lyase family protein [Gemmatimonadetes bacterium]|nr:alginate lyase family protein [Gemmatimonadota bacterium]MBK7923794.1 alginate lyase family protein [Gemmatimonadota bacterium]MBK9069095.1 alginate lyase family protein [Gemmatimonadota bacterium]